VSDVPDGRAPGEHGKPSQPGGMRKADRANGEPEALESDAPGPDAPDERPGQSG
jgi:hypothetical protein